jgi:hypothetical protein
MYPVEKDEWIRQRSRLLSPEAAWMFSNGFLSRVGLDDYDDGQDLIT